METKDPALTKTRIAETDTQRTVDEPRESELYADNHNDINRLDIAHEEIDHKNVDHKEVEGNLTEHMGTEKFTEDVYDSEHVNDNDNPARQPDRRDQSSNGFDDNINEDTVGSEAPKSKHIDDVNRYASVDNAQTRVLNPDEKNSIR